MYLFNFSHFGAHEFYISTNLRDEREWRVQTLWRNDYTFEPYSFVLFVEKEALLETGQQMSYTVSKRIWIKVL